MPTPLPDPEQDQLDTWSAEGGAEHHPQRAGGRRLTRAAEPAERPLPRTTDEFLDEIHHLLGGQPWSP
jgi:hypothetical protein